jgi:hypothetical protein
VTHEIELLRIKEIIQLAKHPTEFEKLLPKLTMDEIVSSLEKIDALIAELHHKEISNNLKYLKMLILEEESLREEFEIG